MPEIIEERGIFVEDEEEELEFSISASTEFPHFRDFNMFNEEYQVVTAALHENHQFTSTVCF